MAEAAPAVGKPNAVRRRLKARPSTRGHQIGDNRFVGSTDASGDTARVTVDPPTADTPRMEAWLRALPPSLLTDSQSAYLEGDDEEPAPYRSGAELLDDVLVELTSPDARIFVRERDLTRDEAMAVLVYTAQCPYLFGDANRNLRLGQRDALEPVWPFLQWLVAALARLPTTAGVVYRALSSRDAAVAYVADERKLWPAFTSASPSLLQSNLNDFGFDPSSREAGVLLVIEVSSARSVGPLSFLPDETEVLLPPG